MIAHRTRFWLGSANATAVRRLPAHERPWLRGKKGICAGKTRAVANGQRRGENEAPSDEKRRPRAAKMQYLTVEIWAGQPGGHQRLLLSSDDVTIGRDPGNDIVIGDPAISPRHARIVRTAGEWLLADEGSADGVWVDGRPYSTVALVNGSRFRIGATTLQFHDTRTQKVVQQRANELRAELGREVVPAASRPDTVPQDANRGASFDDSPTEPRPAPRSPPSSPGSRRRPASRKKTEIDVWTVLGAIAFLALVAGAVASIWEPLLLERIIDWARSWR